MSICGNLIVRVRTHKRERERKGQYVYVLVVISFILYLHEYFLWICVIKTFNKKNVYCSYFMCHWYLHFDV